MHNSLNFFSYENPDQAIRDMDLHDFMACLHGFWKGNIEIRLVRFTNGTNHKSANKAALRLESLGWFDKEFKTHIAIMGRYLVVLLTHYMGPTDPDGIQRTCKYQTKYFVDWINGHVINVRIPPITFESFFSNFQCSLAEMALQ